MENNIQNSDQLKETKEVVLTPESNQIKINFSLETANFSQQENDLIIKLEGQEETYVIKDFLKENQEKVDFILENGEVIPSDAFVETFLSDLQTAAGPNTGNSIQNGARYREYADLDLLDGIDHLRELDWGMNTDVELTTTEETHGFDDIGREYEEVAAGRDIIDEPIIPNNPVPTDIVIPSNPEQEPDPDPTPDPDPEPEPDPDPTPDPTRGYDVSEGTIEYYENWSKRHSDEFNSDNHNIIIGDRGVPDQVITHNTYNISFTFDMTESMLEKMEDGTTRFDSTLLTLKNLVNQFKEASSQENIDVNVQLNTFGVLGEASAWFNIADSTQAEEFTNIVNNLSNIELANMTNYTAGFDLIKEAFENKPEAKTGSNVFDKAYFLSDGNPNLGVNTDTGEISIFADLTTSQRVLDMGYDGYSVDYMRENTHAWEVARERFNKEYPDFRKQWEAENPEMASEIFANDLYAYYSEQHILAIASKQLEEFIQKHPEAYCESFVDLQHNNSLELNVIGFSGPELDMGMLNAFTLNSGMSHEISSTNELIELLNPGEIFSGEYSGVDQVNSGNGNDIIFGDHVYSDELDGSEALKNELNIKNDDPEKLHEAIINNLEHVKNVADKSERDTDGDDRIFGGEGEDIIFAQGGNDYIDGGLGSDMIFAGSGNDIIAYDSNDVIINGGSGIDILLVGDESLDSLFDINGLSKNVSDVEMVVYGNNVTSLTDMNHFNEIGVKLEDNKVEFGDGWISTDSHNGFNAFTNGDITIEISQDAQLQIDLVMNQVSQG